MILLYSNSSKSIEASDKGRTSNEAESDQRDLSLSLSLTRRVIYSGTSLSLHHKLILTLKEERIKTER